MSALGPGARGTWNKNDGPRDRIKLRWTCCDICKTQHRTLLAARIHWFFLRFIRRTHA